MSKILALIKKDLLLERRQQHAFFGILLYVASTIFVLYMTMGRPEADAYNGLFWVIQLFICVNAVAKSFLQESKARMLYYYTVSSPVHFIIAKLVYSLLIMILMVVASLLMFRVFLGSPVMFPLRFAGTALLGGISLSLVFTLMSAIAAKAHQNAAVMAILGFPLIIPQLLLLMRLSRYSLGEAFREHALLQMVALLAGLDVLVIALSVILFPFLWKE